MKRNTKKLLFALGLILPAFAMLCLTIITPLINIIWMSFHDYSLLNIKNIKAWVRYGFAENSLCIRLKCGLDFFFVSVRAYKSKINSKLAHSNIKKIVCAAVYCR